MTEVTEKARHMIKICPANVDNPSEHCVNVKALFDTGAAASYVNRDIAEKLHKEGAFIVPIKPQEIGTAIEGQTAIVRDGIFVKFLIENCDITQYESAGVHILEKASEEAVIGLRDMQFYGIELDIKNAKIKIPECPPKFNIGSSSEMPRKKVIAIE